MDKNYLKFLAYRNKRKSKGMSFFTNTDAGNVELNQAMFNHAMDVNGDFVSPDGANAISESLDADTLGMIETAVRNVNGVELTVKKDASHLEGEDEYFLIVNDWGVLNDLIMEMGITDDDELSGLIEWGFSDEWTTCDHCGRAIHTKADNAFWNPDYWADYDYGEIICGDCVRGSDEEKKNYLDYLTNEPERANTILSNKELETSGYKKLNTEDYANGWYGRNDDPKKILDNALDESPDGEFIFSISSQNPFETSFDLWAKKGTYRDHVDVVAERDIDMHEREFGADGVRAFGSKEDRDEFMSEKEKFNNRYGESKEIEEEPVEDDMKIGDDKEEDREKILNEVEGKEEVEEIEEVEEETVVDDEPHRTVADALKIYGDDGCDVGDNEMDYMWFMNYEENPTDYYDRVQNYIAENTYVEREDENYVLGRFYDFCDKNLDKLA